MNTFFIRNRLQCLIAMKIQKKQTRDRRYAVVFLYQNTTDEDSHHVYDLYHDFAQGGSKTVHLVSREGFIKSFVNAFLIIGHTTLKGGTCFLASIDSLPLGLALRLCPSARLETFDDGSANIIRSSKYFKESNYYTNRVKFALGRFFFPKGWAFWMRQFTRKHHTIYSDYENIVDKERLTFLEWDWSNLLAKEDASYLEYSIKKVVLGTPLSTKEFNDAKCILAAEADLYIAHPREDIKGIFGNVAYLKSPAESVLLFLSRQRNIKVIHFDSSVGYALENEKAIKFINVLDKETRRIRYEEPTLSKLFS